MKLRWNLRWQNIWRTIMAVIFNKYLLALTLFLGWLVFFDKHALLTQWQLSQTLQELRTEKEFILDEIEKTKLIRENLEQNQEKYAREKFYMKKPGEQVFIID